MVPTPQHQHLSHRRPQLRCPSKTSLVRYWIRENYSPKSVRLKRISDDWWPQTTTSWTLPLRFSPHQSEEEETTEIDRHFFLTTATSSLSSMRIRSSAGLDRRRCLHVEYTCTHAEPQRTRRILRDGQLPQSRRLRMVYRHEGISMAISILSGNT
ncbi:hypothetical protein VTN77DRAFT_4958 [Rasamsonia byssochlamydoides]|uniref:uncharacterized protein n=1 Tax=Rasamsonia byssochlamydoides TaxID=89139 RepID=UPI0037440755